MNMNPVGWFEIYVQDMERAKSFYQAILEFKFDKLDSPGMDMWSFPMQQGVPGAAGALVRMEGMPSGGNSTLVYFVSDDCATIEGRVAGAGGKVFKPKMSIGQYGFISLVTDTEGNMIGIHSMK